MPAGLLLDTLSDQFEIPKFRHVAVSFSDWKEFRSRLVRDRFGQDVTALQAANRTRRSNVRNRFAEMV